MAALRVLIVDDEEELVSALVERLEIRGFEATGVHSGKEAIDKSREQSFDVAVVDLKMPKQSGLEVIQKLREQQPDLRCILLTGHGAAENPENARACGAYDCIMKPVNIEVLIESLHAATGH